MSADAFQRTELAKRNQPLLYLAVARRNEHVVTDRHQVFALIRPNADARSLPVLRLTPPRCHFHAIARRSFGSIGAKYPVIKVVEAYNVDSIANLSKQEPPGRPIVRPGALFINRRQPLRTSCRLRYG
jgi:hypothetical protein